MIWIQVHLVKPQMDILSYGLEENVDDGRLDLGQSGLSTGLDWNHSTLPRGNCKMHVADV